MLADSISASSSGSAPGRPVARHPERQAQRHQALLRAVMQVTLQPAPLGVTGLDDPRPGRAHLLKLSLDLRLQPGVLQRQARRGSRHTHQLRLVRSSSS